MIDLLIIALIIFIIIVSISLGFSIYKEIEEYLITKRDKESESLNGYD